MQQTTVLRAGRDHEQNLLPGFGIVVEEADESAFWLEMLADTGIVRMALLKDLLQESKELTAIFTATQYSTRKRTGSD